MGVKFKLEGRSLMISNSEDDEKNLQNLAILHDVTKQYSASEMRREAVQTEKIKIYLIKNHTDSKVLIDSVNNHITAKKMVNEVIATKNRNILYAIMYKGNNELIACQLSFEENDKPFWGVIRTSEFTYRELNYLTDVLSSANIYILTK